MEFRDDFVNLLSYNTFVLHQGIEKPMNRKWFIQ